MPRSKDVILAADLIDKVCPGEEIDVTGIYCQVQNMKLSQGAGFPVFSTVIEGNCIEKRGGHDGLARISELEKREVIRMGR